MNIEEFRDYCLAKKGVTESFPFDQDTLVFKVMGKMFLLLNLDENPSMNLKCDPEEASILRESYEAVKPGYHMNKAHWNTVLLDASIPAQYLEKWIDDSYDLIVGRLPGSSKKQLELPT